MATISFALLLAIIGAASAHPWRFVNTFKLANCGLQPGRAFGEHQAPKKDARIAFTVTAKGKAITNKVALCPGSSYVVQATFGDEIHHALLTTNVGSWAKAPVKGCGRSYYETVRANKLGATLSIPCNAKGKAVFWVTHSEDGDPYFQATTSYTINPKCAAASCSKRG